MDYEYDDDGSNVHSSELDPFPHEEWVWVTNISCLRQLEKKKSTQRFNELYLSEPPEPKECTEYDQLLREILADPSCRVEKITARGVCSNFLECDRARMGPVVEYMSTEGNKLRKLTVELDWTVTRTGMDVWDIVKEGMGNPNCRLKVFRIKHCRIGKLFMESFFTPVTVTNVHRGLECACFEECIVDSYGAAELAKCLTHPNFTLKQLSIKNSSFNFLEASILLTALSRPVCKLEYIALDDSLELSSENDDIAMSKLLQGAITAPGKSLKGLSLRGLGMMEESVRTLFRALVHPNNRLEVLDLSGNIIGLNGFALLSEALVHEHCQLRHLGLNEMDMDDSALSKLARAISSTPNKLEGLDVAGPREFFSRGAIAIAEALKSPNNRLTHLIIDNVPNVVANFTESLKSVNNKLRYLQLRVAPTNANAAFFKQLRTSTVTRFECRNFQMNQHRFIQAFHQEFMKIMVTLLSVNYVPRLVKTVEEFADGTNGEVRYRIAPLAYLPMTNFIIPIARTLGWKIRWLVFPG